MPGQATVLVTDAVARKRGDELQRILGGRGRLQVLVPEQPPTADELAGVQAAFLSTDLMAGSNKQQPNQRMLAFGAAMRAAPDLRWIHSCASGTDRDILQEAMRRGVTVTSSAGANATSVAHAAIAGLLALNRGVPGWVRAQDAHHWQAPSRELTPRDLPGQHAVIVGTGAIGSEIARVCRALHMRVTGLRQQATPHPDFDAIGTLADLPALAPETDWLILCCPLTAATRGVVDAGLLARLPPRASLINVGRGELVVEPDLFDAMQRGALAGVFSDVFVNEPLPADSPWWTLPRTLLSSHLGGLTDGFARRTQEIFLDNLQRWLDGREMRNVARAGATPA